MLPLRITIISLALITKINCEDTSAAQGPTKPDPSYGFNDDSSQTQTASHKSWIEEKLSSRTDIVNVTVIHHDSVYYRNVEVLIGVGQIPESLNDLKNNTYLCGTISKNGTNLGKFWRQTINCKTVISADYIIIYLKERIPLDLNAILVNNKLVPILKSSYNLTSSGDAKTKYPKLMGVYKLSEEDQNYFPVYKQDDGPGLAYVDPNGYWVVGEQYNGSRMFSGEYPITTSPPETNWYYVDWNGTHSVWNGTDSTLRMVPINSEPLTKFNPNPDLSMLIGLSVTSLLLFIGIAICCIKSWKESIKKTAEEAQDEGVFHIRDRHGKGLSEGHILFWCGCILERDSWWGRVVEQFRRDQGSEVLERIDVNSVYGYYHGDGEERLDEIVDYNVQYEAPHDDSDGESFAEIVDHNHTYGRASEVSYS